MTVLSGENSSNPNYLVSSNHNHNRKDDIFNVTKAAVRKSIFDANNKSQSGKFIPLSKDTGLPHECPQ
jgi:hypothetical protein